MCFCIFNLTQKRNETPHQKLSKLFQSVVNLKLCCLVSFLQPLVSRLAMKETAVKGLVTARKVWKFIFVWKLILI